MFNHRYQNSVALPLFSGRVQLPYWQPGPCVVVGAHSSRIVAKHRAWHGQVLEVPQRQGRLWLQHHLRHHERSHKGEAQDHPQERHVSLVLAPPPPPEQLLCFLHYVISLSMLWCLNSNCRWVIENQAVYNALVNDIMKPRIDEVSKLLSRSHNVASSRFFLSSSFFFFHLTNIISKNNLFEIEKKGTTHFLTVWWRLQLANELNWFACSKRHTLRKQQGHFVMNL